jgi:hypothetical protein
MIIQDVRRTQEREDVQALSAIITFESPRPRSFRVYFEFQGAPGEIADSADPFVIGFLCPAMVLGEDMTIHGTVDPELLLAIRSKIVPLLRRWLPALSIPRLEVDEQRSPPIRSQPGMGAAAFSGGLDAVYAAVKHREDIDWLVASQGFDVRTFHQDYWNKILSNIRDAAGTLAKPLMTVRTNLREISHYEAIRTREGRIDPGYYKLGHNGPIGPYFAAIARCMIPFCSRFTIGSTTTFDDLFVYGSHPLLDPMWSTSQLRIVHSGCESSRIEKIAFLKREHPSGLQKLRVCWTPRGDVVNCGRCEKCIRTMAELTLCDAEGLAETFHWPMDVAPLRRAGADRLRFRFWSAIRQEALRQGKAELAAAAGAFLGTRRLLLERWHERSRRRRTVRMARARWRHSCRTMKPPSKDLYEVATPD